MTRIPAWAVALVAIFLLAACRMQGNPDLEQAVTRAEPGAGSTVLDATDVSASRVCVLAPYTSEERFEKVTGVRWPQVANEAIAVDDGIELVVAIAGDEVVAWAEVDRPRGGDLLGGSDRCSD